jgi:hypothetical protein
MFPLARSWQSLAPVEAERHCETLFKLLVLMAIDVAVEFDGAADRERAHEGVWRN